MGNTIHYKAKLLAQCLLYVDLHARNALVEKRMSTGDRFADIIINLSYYSSLSIFVSGQFTTINTLEIGNPS